MVRHDLWLHLDNLKRKAFIRYEFKRNLLKSIKVNKAVPYSRRVKATFHLSNMPKISSKTYSGKRCVISGRVWSVNKHANISRFEFRNQVYSSNLPGCSRASW